MSTTASASSLPLPSRTAPRFPAWVRAVRWLRRMTFLLHRWLGIALALLMLLWTLSGFVMMYVSYPATSAAERAAGLQPLDLSRCCASTALPSSKLDSAVVEMVAGRPVLRWTAGESSGLLDLATGTAPNIDAPQATAIARTYMQRAFGSSPQLRAEPIEVDQWTLQQRGAAPLFKVSADDARGTVLYVSGKSGEVVQDTHRSERFWNWLGAVPHWLYFTQLRQDGELWSQVVIYASLLGTFLTLTGIYVGLRMYGRGKRKSPFRGVALWHHWTGLIFGLVTLTWVFSGFASMQPWGWLESEGPSKEVQALAGRPLEGADAAALVAALRAHPQPGMVSAEASMQGSKPFAILVRADGSRTRAALPGLAPAPLTRGDLDQLGRMARPQTRPAEQGMIKTGDAYHYDHHSTPAILPAWRVILEGSRLYFDPRTGELIDYVDAGGRDFRWWHLALHRLDLPGLSARPLWDIVMLPLLAGVALVCGLGAWMGWRRLSRPKKRLAQRG